MEQWQKDWIQETKQNAGKLAPYVDKDLVDKMLLVYTLEDGDKKVKEEIDSYLNTFSNKLVLSGKTILECPSQLEAQGPIGIGTVLQGDRSLWPFGLSQEEINQHMLVIGRSGSGKTTLIVNTMRELTAQKIPFLALDMKQDYRHLVRERSELVVMNWKDLKLNPLEPPPGVDFQEWKQQFLNIFGHVEGIWHGSTQYLLKAIDEVCAEKKSIPKLGDIYKKISDANENSRKIQEYASVVETRLYGILSKLGDTINSERTTIDIEQLLQLPVILELHGLGRDETTIIALWIFYWIYAYRRAKGMRGKLEHVLIIDEAKRIFTGSEQYSQTTTEYSGIPPADLVCDEIRDFGEGIIASDQEPTKLSNSLKANTYTKITGFLGNGKDINDVADAMDLNEEEREAITKLERGEWLVKLAGRYTKPFVMKSDDFPLRKDVSDQEISQLMRPKLEWLKKKSVTTTKSENPQHKSQDTALSADSWTLLFNINSHPFNGIAGRKKELGISATRLENAKKQLISKGLVKQMDIALTGKRPTAFLVLTDRGTELLESKNIDTQLWRHVGHVGFEHILYQVLIRWQIQKLGYEAHIEAVVDDRRIDVLAQSGDECIGFEVELNANADIEAKLRNIGDLDELCIVSRKELVPQINQSLGSVPDNVEVCSINALLAKLNNMISEQSEITSFSKNKTESTTFQQNHSEAHPSDQKDDESNAGGT